jgi:hypothetical protein
VGGVLRHFELLDRLEARSDRRVPSLRKGANDRWGNNRDHVPKPVNPAYLEKPQCCEWGVLGDPSDQKEESVVAGSRLLHGSGDEVLAHSAVARDPEAGFQPLHEVW